MTAWKPFAAVRQGIVVFLVLLLATNLRDMADWAGFPIPGLPLPAYAGSSMDNLLLVVVAVLAVLLWPGRAAAQGLVQRLGLGACGWRGPMLVLLSTVPFWVSSALTGTVHKAIDWQGLLFTVLLFPFAEELAFRGFGFVFPCLGWRWPRWYAVLLQAACFGLYHWWGLRGSDEALIVFALTFLGGVVFAVLDALNRYTIWSGLLFHISLNAAWGVFDMSTASGGWGMVSNAMRLVSAGLAVALLWRLARSSTSTYVRRATGWS